MWSRPITHDRADLGLADVGTLIFGETVRAPFSGLGDCAAAAVSEAALEALRTGDGVAVKL